MGGGKEETVEDCVCVCVGGCARVHVCVCVSEQFGDNKNCAKAIT